MWKQGIVGVNVEVHPSSRQDACACLCLITKDEAQSNRSAPPSKNAVSTNVKDFNYVHLISGESTTVVKGFMNICLIW